MSNLYLDLHVLQTIPPSDLNRDDAGQPKTAIYGNALRSRVSSQAWKHAMRHTFAELRPDLCGYRTKLLPQQLEKALRVIEPSLSDADVTKKLEGLYKNIGLKKKAKDDFSLKSLFFVGQAQLNAVAQYLLDHDPVNKDKDTKKALTELLTHNQTLDQALFGRMVADNQELGIDASSQIAHVISTHEIVPEFDYFTAADEKDEDLGAAMIGSTGYNSATLYRYGNLNLRQLSENLGDSGLVIKSIEPFIRSFVLSMPTGKQNSFANKTVPSYVLATLRSDTPVNLVTGFETSVKSHQDGFLNSSVIALEKEYQKVSAFVKKPVAAIVLNVSDSVSIFGDSTDSLDALIQDIQQNVSKELNV